MSLVSVRKTQSCEYYVVADLMMKIHLPAPQHRFQSSGHGGRLLVHRPGKGRHCTTRQGCHLPPMRKRRGTTRARQRTWIQVPLRPPRSVVVVGHAQHRQRVPRAIGQRLHLHHPTKNPRTTNLRLFPNPLAVPRSVAYRQPPPVPRSPHPARRLPPLPH